MDSDKMKMHTEKERCSWCLKFDQYIQYHDEEWGVPVHDDQTHFEFLILEGAQAGLSWSTILKKREGYRKVFRQRLLHMPGHEGGISLIRGNDAQH